MKNLVTYEWNFKKFTSQYRLNELFMDGVINREVTPRHEFGSDYKYSTKDGKHIASFYKDSSFGFGTQATGIELMNVTALSLID